MVLNTLGETGGNWVQSPNHLTVDGMQLHILDLRHVVRTDDEVVNVKPQPGQMTVLCEMIFYDHGDL